MLDSLLWLYFFAWSMEMVLETFFHSIERAKVTKQQPALTELSETCGWKGRRAAVYPNGVIYCVKLELERKLM